MAELRQIVNESYQGPCSACGSTRWVVVSLNGERIPQCVPCGAFHRGVVLSDA